MQNWLHPITLEGKVVRLEPLQTTHQAALLQAASDGKLWELWFTSVPSKNSIDAYLKKAFDDQAAGLALPFVVIDQASNSIIGSTRYCNVDAPNRRLEIGYTWYAKSFQRTGVNTECKFLLLRHAFEQLEAIAVEFRTHFYNQASRKAILRLGAKQDGILRNHRLGKNGIIRDTVVFSILPNEWPAVKHNLEFKMDLNYRQ